MQFSYGARACSIATTVMLPPGCPDFGGLTELGDQRQDHSLCGPPEPPAGAKKGLKIGPGLGL